jgi:hypothetical protein
MDRLLKPCPTYTHITIALTKFSKEPMFFKKKERERRKEKPEKGRLMAIPVMYDFCSKHDFSNI